MGWRKILLAGLLLGGVAFAASWWYANRTVAKVIARSHDFNRLMEPQQDSDMSAEERQLLLEEHHRMLLDQLQGNPSP